MSAESPNPALTDVQYWEEQRAPSIQRVGVSSYLAPYLKDQLPSRKDWSCLEVGAVPGSRLVWLCQQFGYEPWGIDFCDQVNDLPEAFRLHGLEGHFVQADFLEWKPDRLFDVVYSCGFVEHFENYPEIVLKHWELVRPGGYMVLEIPAWSPLQVLLRKLVYTPEHWESITSSHVTSMMNLTSLQAAVESCPNARVILSRYIREMTLWIRPGDPGVKKGTWLTFAPFRVLERLCSLLRLSSRLISPSVLCVAHKPAEAE
jgi:SAM-dependent methyltransferase